MKGALARGRLALAERFLPRPSVIDALSVLNTLPTPTVVLDADNRFRFANQAAEQFLGVSLLQLGQMSLATFIPADNPLFALLQQVRHQEITIADHDLTLESPRLHKTGISVQAAPLMEEPGSIVLTLQDSSAARALDRQMLFRGAARSVVGMSAMLAHEVKNPLSGIRGAAQLLEANATPADQELTQLIQDEADRIRILVDRMEEFDDRPIERRAVNIHRVLEHVRRLAQAGFGANIRFTELYDPSLPPAWANRDQLIQVLLNLVKNAAEAIEDHAAMAGLGEISLTTAYQHGVRVAVPGSDHRMQLPLVVTVRDNGPGISDDIRPHLFEPFVTSRPSGRGLGLALVAKIVGDHGGSIEVDSRPGRTEFRLCLPVLSEADSDQIGRPNHDLTNRPCG